MKKPHEKLPAAASGTDEAATAAMAVEIDKKERIIQAAVREIKAYLGMATDDVEKILATIDVSSATTDSPAVTEENTGWAGTLMSYSKGFFSGARKTVETAKSAISSLSDVDDVRPDRQALALATLKILIGNDKTVDGKLLEVKVLVAQNCALSLKSNLKADSGYLHAGLARAFGIIHSEQLTAIVKEGSEELKRRAAEAKVEDASSAPGF